MNAPIVRTSDGALLAVLCILLAGAIVLHCIRKQFISQLYALLVSQGTENMQRITAIAFVLCGISLLAFGYQAAAQIPAQAEEDFGALVRTAGGSFISSSDFPEVFKQMHAERRLLQNEYIGGSGLVLLAVGTLGCVLPAKRREA